MKLSLTSRIFVILVLSVAMLLSLVSVLSYRNGSEDLKASAISELSAMAIEKEAALDAWSDERLEDIKDFAGARDLVERTADLASAVPGSEKARSSHALLLQELQPHLRGQQSSLEGLFVIEVSEGRVLASTNPADEGKSKKGHGYFENGKSGVFLQGPYYSADLRAAAITASVPIRSSKSGVIGVLAARLSLDQMGRIVQRRSGLRLTDDSYLINGERNFVTQPRYIDEPVVLNRRLDTEQAREVVAGNSGVVISADYRGVRVISAYRWLPRHGLGLLVEIDESEALAPARSFGRSVALIGVLALLAMMGLALLLARSITKPLRALHTQMSRFAKGEIEEPLMESSDELGLLARQFNRMSDSVRKHTAELAESNLALQAENLERERAERALRNLQEFQAGILAGVGHGIQGIDATGKIIFENEASARMLGWNTSEILGSPAHATMHHHRADGMSYPVDECPIYTTLRDGQLRKGSDELFWRRDGTSFSVEYTVAPMRSAAGDQTGAVIVFEDITERKLAEEKLRETEERCSDLFDNATDLIQAISIDGRFLAVNPAWLRAFGYTEDELAGINLYDVIHPDYHEQCMRLRELMATGERVENLGVAFVAKDGRTIYVEGNAHCQFKNGKPAATVAILRDVTQKRDLETNLTLKSVALESAANGIAITSRDGAIQWINPAFTRLTGYDRMKSSARTRALSSQDNNRTNFIGRCGERSAPEMYGAVNS